MFHYTNATAANGIVFEKKIRLTHILFQNDREEYNGGIKILLQHLHTIQNSNKLTDLSKEIFAGAIDILRDNSATLKPSIYTMSFSTNNDSLNQWRSYGHYCIELSEEIQNLIDGDQFYLQKCIYDDTTFLSIAEDRLNLVTNHPTTLNLGNENMKIVLSGLLKNLIATKKDCRFSEEQEIRLIYNTLPLPLSEHRHEIKYAANPFSDIIKPYVELQIKEEHLKSVRIGPHSDQALAQEAFLIHNQIQKELQKPSLPIHLSDIPYRG
ncbi:hypothetical protein [Aliamphritea hakodatensis]|uniref:hypothetical protein n=1 Tax=Aliamphritea hakodatensis TaxID=2895352 RepID=UPI0022FD4C3A|nr:hypothetical protein [Aliamphritea hakodatensis]